MPVHDPSGLSHPPAPRSSRLSGVGVKALRTAQLRPGDIQLYRSCDELSGWVIYLMVVFSPWAFGTTEPWSIRIMDGAGYLLGSLLLVKWIVRRWKGYSPARWDQGMGRRLRTSNGKLRVLGVLTVLILGYCLVSALNAAATKDPSKFSFDYHGHIGWLPHSFDGNRSWQALRDYLALALGFWSVRDWLQGRAGDELRVRPEEEGVGRVPLITTRLKRLLWLLSINGGLLAVEGMIQRFSGTGMLLFMVPTKVNQAAEHQFGPYHYRGSAASFFNLLWPVCLGFWWSLQRVQKHKTFQNNLLLVSVGLMAVCPIICLSRGGAFVDFVLVAAAPLCLGLSSLLRSRQDPSASRKNTSGFWKLGVFPAAVLAFGLYQGWHSLSLRLTAAEGGLDARRQMCEDAQPMVADFPAYGTGPGTFETVFELYRIVASTYWAAQLHNDWLETRITFGWVGSALIALAFLDLLSLWFRRAGPGNNRDLVLMIWLALAGCLVHARWDFPFQIYSILFLFLILCSILSLQSMSRTRTG